jgi:dynein heavy chain 1
LNPLLNKELQRTGGRTLVRIGTEDIDYSPDFMIVLSTKNPAVHLTPDVCSRVTLANFTVTPASLQSQSLSKVLSYEKPELETQRAAVLKLQGEQNVKLRELEDQMLAKISACEGSILEDDEVVAGMEILMKEGGQVEDQIEQSDKVMAQVHLAVSEFEPFAAICRNVFILLGALRGISFLYEFSSNTFMTILEHVLKENKSNSSGGDGASETQRISELKTALFNELVSRIARGLKSIDKVAFSVLLARLFNSDDSIGATECETTDDYISSFVQVFGNDFDWQGRDELHAVVEEIDSTSPLLICSAPGYDVSGRVESMARETGKELHSVAMGSSEGFDTAESLVSGASKRGTWVMLKNVHLCPDWLNETFVKKLQTFGHSTNKDFRLFMSSFSKARLENSLIRNRLYLLVAWTHAVLEERVRYGWTYELAEADSVNALKVIDDLINVQIMDPDQIPFDALCTTLKVDVFGSRIALVDDQNIIDTMIDSIFTKSAFDLQFPLVPALDESPVLPDSSSRGDINKWITNLPSHTPPTWVGLGEDAEMALEKVKAETIHTTVQKVSSAVLTSK